MQPDYQEQLLFSLVAPFYIIDFLLFQILTEEICQFIPRN